MFDIKKFQKEHQEWAERNFGEIDYRNAIMGIAEEFGELNHHLLKQAQGIRGTSEEHEEQAKDSIGDMIVYMAHLCTLRGWDLEELIENTWNSVKERDWKKDPNRGVTATEAPQSHRE